MLAALRAKTNLHTGCTAVFLQPFPVADHSASFSESCLRLWWGSSQILCISLVYHESHGTPLQLWDSCFRFFLNRCPH